MCCSLNITVVYVNGNIIPTILPSIGEWLLLLGKQGRRTCHENASRLSGGTEQLNAESYSSVLHPTTNRSTPTLHSATFSWSTQKTNSNSLSPAPSYTGHFPTQSTSGLSRKQGRRGEISGWCWFWLSFDAGAGTLVFLYARQVVYHELQPEPLKACLQLYFACTLPPSPFIVTRRQRHDGLFLTNVFVKLKGIRTTQNHRANNRKHTLNQHPRGDKNQNLLPHQDNNPYQHISTSKKTREGSPLLWILSYLFTLKY